MRVFMSPTFIEEVRKLHKSNDHGDCERVLIDSIYTGTIDQVIQGGNSKKLGGSPNTPFIRRRMESQGQGKSSGYRLYLWAFRIEEDVYLLYIHPKTGRRSATNISAEYQKGLVAEFKEFRDKGCMALTKLSKDGTRILFDDRAGKAVFG
jgi:hypothetical protein